MFSKDVSCGAGSLAASQTIPENSRLMSDYGVGQRTLPKPYTRPNHLEVVASNVFGREEFDCRSVPDCYVQLLRLVVLLPFPKEGRPRFSSGGKVSSASALHA